MSDRGSGILGIGNAIVDVISQAGDQFLETHGLAKGAMTLIDGEGAERLYDAMGPGLEMSGGSAANTMVGVAALAGEARFIGKVRDDQLGAIFRHDIRAAGVAFESTPASKGAGTARCLILVTDDAQRTMATYLGASVGLAEADIDEAAVAAAAVTYLEGYLWDAPSAKAAFLKAARCAHEAGGQVALTLSDPFCVERHRESFRELVAGHVDILFANEGEIISLYESASFDEALQVVRGHCRVAALTRSEKGSVVLSGDEVHVVDAEPVAQVVDTTGAGDLYAAGFLYGYASGRPLYECGLIGSVAAAEIISHYGARPEKPLADLAASRLGHEGGGP